jgi:hypothetical protein
VSEDEDEVRTTQQDITDGAVIAVVFALVGGIGGMVYGSLTSAGLTKGIGIGVVLGTTLGLIIALIRLIVLACDGGGFTWLRTRKVVFEMITAVILCMIVVGVVLSMGENLSLPTSTPAASLLPSKAGRSLYV